MKDTEKYLIHATIAADGVVERSDVVGAVFGQTEGLLGDELDLRDLQESSRVGRIDVAVESENGQSFGEVTVASSLDKVETAILAAALETIDRIGPCHASVEVTSIEDVRAAKRREVVERAKELVAGGFEETSLASSDVLEEVRDAARVEGIVDYEGLPAGPRVGDSDAVIVVEGRADVLTLLGCGIKNAVAVEGTNVPEAVADLTADRTVTAFLDGDRGGELILRELAQVGEVDYVAFAPPGESVEDLGRDAVFEALRGKVPYASLADAADLRAAANDESPADGDDSGSVARVGDGGAVPSDSPADDSPGPSPESPEPSESSGVDRADEPTESREGPVAADGESTESGDESAESADAASGTAGGAGTDVESGSVTDDSLDVAETDEPDPESTDGSDAGPTDGSDAGPTDGSDAGPTDESDAGPTDGSDAGPTDESDAGPTGNTDAEPVGDEADGSGEADADETADEPRSIGGHVREVVDGETGRARFLGEGFDRLDEVDAADAFDALDAADTAPHAVVVDGTVDQRLLDVAAQRGVSDLIGRDLGEFVKRPAGTRVLAAADVWVEG
ncbi:DNA primase DnaG [Halorubrum tebenquichense]|uniref:DNA primase DnaG n=1 Tax=Halorubrum tebenquichense DSM 14210 TaxID=1227485 RepID=M0DFL1_9EURY|nr:DNA primase DnaG [Halorubrum tebenquichense]ELZ34260.1 DNA primase [Halorubrum tebenquichense DSM 14210]